MYINLSRYYFDKCAKFADDQLKSSEGLYRYRGEFRKSKMREDIIIGKLGEIAAYEYLKSRGYKVNKPDFTIYERKRKSYDADLTTECGKKVHVKSQGYESMARYGASWLLQKGDSLVKKPKEEEFILMVSMRGLEANVLGVVRAVDIFSNKLFEKPKVSRYAETKKALYFNSIKCKGVSLEAI